MKMFLALAALALATSAATQATVTSPDSIIRRPTPRQAPAGESLAKLPLPRPKFAPVVADASERNWRPRPPRFAAVDATALRKPPRPKFQDSESIRKPRFTAAESLALRKPPRPKFQDSNSFSPAESLTA